MLHAKRRRSWSRLSSAPGFEPCRRVGTLVRTKSVIETVAIRPERNVVDVRSHNPLGLEQVTPCVDRSANKTNAKNAHDSMIQIICFSSRCRQPDNPHHQRHGTIDKEPRMLYRRAPTRLTPPFMLPPAL